MGEEEEREEAECANCGSTRQVEGYKRPWTKPGQDQNDLVDLCHVCANTHAGSNIMYPGMYADSERVMAHISATTNMILDAIEAQPTPSGERKD